MAKVNEGNSGPNALQELIDALNEDLAREYQAIIAYTVYSNVLTGAQWMNIAAELKKHAHEELEHALIIADQLTNPTKSENRELYGLRGLWKEKMLL